MNLWNILIFYNADVSKWNNWIMVKYLTGCCLSIEIVWIHLVFSYLYFKFLSVSIYHGECLFYYRSSLFIFLIHLFEILKIHLGLLIFSFLIFLLHFQIFYRLHSFFIIGLFRFWSLNFWNYLNFQDFVNFMKSKLNFSFSIYHIIIFDFVTCQKYYRCYPSIFIYHLALLNLNKVC